MVEPKSATAATGALRTPRARMCMGVVLMAAGSGPVRAPRAEAGAAGVWLGPELLGPGHGYIIENPDVSCGVPRQTRIVLIVARLS